MKSDKEIEVSARHQIDVTQMEFDEGGNTIWIHSPLGGTVLRIKCTGKITVDRKCTNSVPHADMIVEGDIDICIPQRLEAPNELQPLRGDDSPG